MTIRFFLQPAITLMMLMNSQVSADCFAWCEVINKQVWETKCAWLRCRSCPACTDLSTASTSTSSTKAAKAATTSTIVTISTAITSATSATTVAITTTILPKTTKVTTMSTTTTPAISVRETKTFGVSTTRTTTPDEPLAVDVTLFNAAPIPVTSTEFVDSNIEPKPEKILLIIGGVISIVVVALTMITAITCWLGKAVAPLVPSHVEKQLDDWSDDDLDDLKRMVPRKDADSTGSDQLHHTITMYDDEDYAQHGDSESLYADDE